MTLYLLFEQLESGKLKLDSEMEVSEHASEQAPTKLGLRPGQTLKVEDAIKGLVTRSANDAAVVIAEAIAGDEDDFAKLMTRKARALGMTKTTYRNASGLPNDEQVTTARDQATLGRAIQDRFPTYYRYFSTSVFNYRGQSIRNHNHLLGSVEGAERQVGHAGHRRQDDRRVDGHGTDVDGLDQAHGKARLYRRAASWARIAKFLPLSAHPE